MNSHLTEVTIRRKDGFTFTGTAYDCAMYMLPDAYRDSFRLGGMGDMELGEFCRRFNMKLDKPPFGEWTITTNRTTP